MFVHTFIILDKGVIWPDFHAKGMSPVRMQKSCMHAQIKSVNGKIIAFELDLSTETLMLSTPGTLDDLKESIMSETI